MGQSFQIWMCCLQGQIQLPPLQPLTGILHNYLTGDDYLSREFCNNIRQYNVAFAMTSVGVKIDNSVTRQSGPYCFKIQGELHHLTGALLPCKGDWAQDSRRILS